MNILSSSISCFACPDCSTGGIKLSQNKAKYGLPIQYFLRCPNIDCSFEKNFWSSAKAGSCRSFNVNKQLIYALRRIGIGWSGISTFFMLMDSPSAMSHSSYDKLIKKIHKSLKDMALEVMKESTEEVYNLGCVTTDSVVSDVSDLSNAVNTSVPIDGTWQKRGFWSVNGPLHLYLLIQVGYLMWK